MKSFHGAAKIFVVTFLLILTSHFIYCQNDNFPITVKDGLGREVTVRSLPKKIVSTAPSNTEILYDLGLEDSVVAVTSHCIATSDISEKDVVGGWSDPSIIKKVEALKPDLVLAFGGLQQPLADEMNKRGITVFVFFPKTVNEVLEQVVLVGKITGVPVRAEDVVRKNRNKLHKIQAALSDMPAEKRLKCLRLMSTEAMVIGGDSFQSDIIKKAGGVNIFEDIEDDYPVVSFEDVYKKDPDIIVFNRNDEEKAIEWFLGQEHWRDLRAARNRNLASISCDYICHPNTRIAETVEMLARRFYPGRLPIVAIDATGKAIKFFEKPARIVSLNPSATEILYALNAGKSLIAVTEFCPFPELRMEKESIGTILNPDVEKIIALKPDLVFATTEGNRKASIDSLINAGVNVFVLGEIRRFDDIYTRIDMMGAILRNKREADQLILSMRKRIRSIKKKLAGKSQRTVFLQLGAKPIVTANKDTIMNEIIELAGGENIAKDAFVRYPKYSREDVVIQDPDTIIIVSMGRFGEDALRQWRTHKGMKAVRENKVCIIDSTSICHMGPRLVEGVEKMASILYPEEFDTKGDI